MFSSCMHNGLRNKILLCAMFFGRNWVDNGGQDIP